MKSEHRHELHTNDLGKITEKAAQSLGGFFETYGNRIMIAVCAASLISAGIIYYVRRSNFKEAAAWSEMASARKDTDYADIAERYVGTTAAPWAKLQEAESHLQQGIQAMFTDREKAVDVDLKKSRTLLESLVSDRALRGEIRERALFALARCQESTAKGDAAEAVATYEKLLKEFPRSVYKPLAENRIAELKTGRAQDFYAWFAQQNPKPAPVKKPADRGHGGDAVSDDLLEKLAPSLNLPKLDPDAGPLLSPPPTSTKPIPEEAEKPAEPKASEKPAEKEPEPEKKDATEKPSDNS